MRTTTRQAGGRPVGNTTGHSRHTAVAARGGGLRRSPNGVRQGPAHVPAPGPAAAPHSFGGVRGRVFGVAGPVVLAAPAEGRARTGGGATVPRPRAGSGAARAPRHADGGSAAGDP
ncbi:hypothetical protein GCM10010515_39340 [Streptomyces fructofermentans]|uniref:Uncharacterized protein n=1 Tax=Streptomyces fructofermentans TaxID=152141 RepID=A0A918KLG1_9ACTN|nr:hypothetical protein GCM10010515_39340 [Streptomyces fructofermentans]